MYINSNLQVQIHQTLSTVQSLSRGSGKYAASDFYHVFVLFCRKWLTLYYS